MTDVQNQTPGEAYALGLWYVFAESPIPTLLMTKDGRLIALNGAVAELTGYTLDEVPDATAWQERLFPRPEPPGGGGRAQRAFAAPRDGRQPG